MRRLSPARAAAVAAAALLLGAGLWNWNRHRTIPISRLVSPAYWVQHWRGLDRYDPHTALLQQGDPTVKAVALTIDDGPDPRYGPAIAAYLKSQHVPATFFLVGIRVKQHPEIARLLARDGFEIGNHTYDHQRLDALPPHEIASELRLGDARIAAATGHAPALMRPPGVQYNDKVLHVARALGYVTVSWTVGAADYEVHPPRWIAGRILDRTQPGAIILLHQDTPDTLAALPAIVDGLRARGYRFETVSAMLDQLHARRPVPAPPAPPVRAALDKP